MLNCFYDCYTILNKVYSEKTFIKQAISNTAIEEKNRTMTVKVCYGVLDKDIELSYYISLLTEKNPKLVIRTILKISMFCIKFLGKKDYAVVKNAVELTKKLGKGGMSGFVNAFLRKFISNDLPLPNGEKEFTRYLSVKYSYPEFAVKELIKDYGKEKAEKIISAENPYNTLVFYGINGENYLTEKGVNFEKTVFENVYSVKNFVRNKDFTDGLYTFQALGSVAICELVDGCDSLLDCCSAPGGKSVRLSYKCNHVTSWDIHEHRVKLVGEYATRMKRDNICYSVCDAKVFNQDFVQKFDAVLVDAPCSGLGVVNDNPDIKLNRDENSIDELTKEQFAILSNVKNYVKRGGYLYYSTCSTLLRENIQIIEKFLKENEDFSIESVDSKLPHLDFNGTNQFLPDISGGLGFYFAKLKRS